MLIDSHRERKICAQLSHGLSQIAWIALFESKGDKLRVGWSFKSSRIEIPLKMAWSGDIPLHQQQQSSVEQDSL
jgi:hypothetical protein